MNQEKEIFRKFCEGNKELPLFLTYDWMQTVAMDSWDIVLDYNEGMLRGFHLYCIVRKYFFRMIHQPLLTPYSGVYINYPEGQKGERKIAWEKKVLETLISKLPVFDAYKIPFHPTFNYWLPFHWAGFAHSGRITYIIEHTNSVEQAFSDMHESVRREIRKAEKELSVEFSPSVDGLYSLKLESYTWNNMKLPVNKTLLERVFNFCKEKDCGKIYSAFDRDRNLHASIMVVWDNHCAYYLFGASDTTHKTSGAMSLLLWQAVQDNITCGRDFNFEGSMIEPIEKFFRNFGGSFVNYHQVEKTNSFILRFKKMFS
ncbi:MAG: GNAT family N-acetyltransferase [Cytophagaceae bacterium]